MSNEPRLTPVALLAVAAVLAVMHLASGHTRFDGCVLVGILTAALAVWLMRKPAWHVEWKDEK